MGVWVTERAKPIVVFLTGRIPQCEFNVFSVNLYICNVILKDRGDINLIENGIFRLGNGEKRRYQPLGKFLLKRLSTGKSKRDRGMRCSRERVVESACLSASTVAYYDEFSPDLGHWSWLWSESSSVSTASL